LFVNVDERLAKVMLKYASARGVTMEDAEMLTEERQLKAVALDGFLPEEVPDLTEKIVDRQE